MTLDSKRGQGEVFPFPMGLTFLTLTGVKQMPGII